MYATGKYFIIEYINRELWSRKVGVDMCTEKDNEELIEALVKAARAAFLSLKETTKEHFYFYALIFDEGLHPYISAWSYEA